MSPPTILFNLSPTLCCQCSYQTMIFIYHFYSYRLQKKLQNWYFKVQIIRSWWLDTRRINCPKIGIHLLDGSLRRRYIWRQKCCCSLFYTPRRIQSSLSAFLIIMFHRKNSADHPSSDNQPLLQISRQALYQPPSLRQSQEKENCDCWWCGCRQKRHRGYLYPRQRPSQLH